MTLIQDSVKQLVGITDCYYNKEDHSLTIFVKQSFWDQNLEGLKLRVRDLLDAKGLVNFFQESRIIYTPVILEVSQVG